MALLQIAEPGRAAAPHQHRLAVGIDLGTTNSLVATVRSGVPTSLPDEAGALLLPSVVHYRSDGEVTVGRGARAMQGQDPLNAIASAKRLIGRSLAEAGHTPYRLEGVAGGVGLRTAAGLKTPQDVGAEVLKVLKARAEASLGGPLVGAVITVPAYFDDAQRAATKQAAQVAGLNVLRLLNEPTAAAVAYGLDGSLNNGDEGHVLVYDLGGGTFDVSLLRLSRGVFEVIATGGDTTLGGDDFDARLALWFEEEVPGLALTAGDRALLLAAAREGKEQLTDAEQATLSWRSTGGQQHAARIGRACFERLTEDLLARTLAAVKRVLRDGKLKADEVDAVVLVGGATRMPMVRRAVSELFGKRPHCHIDPDQAVALGAAIQADALAGNRAGGDSLLLLDVCPLSLGLETMGGLVERIIARNTTLPTARAQEFTTFKDGQTALSLHVVQGEREVVAECRSLARFVLRGIPPMAAGAARIRVTFQIDADGLLSVIATEQTSGATAHVDVKPAHGLAHAQVSALLRGAMGHAEEDAATRMLREAEIDARRLIDATDVAIGEDGQRLLQPGELRAILGGMQNLADALETIAAEGEGADGTARRALAQQLRDATAALNQITTPFAARRMDLRVRQALGGRKLEQVA